MGGGRMEISRKERGEKLKDQIAECVSASPTEGASPVAVCPVGVRSESSRLPEDIILSLHERS